MFILIRLTQHVSGTIMPIVRKTDYVNNCMWSMPATRKNVKFSVEIIYKHLYLWHLVGSFLSYINDARSHEPKEWLKIQSL